MLVYRYLSKTELNNILNNDLSNIGSIYDRTKYKYRNNHKYKPNLNYLHFFLEKSDCFRVRNLHNEPNEEFFVCTFDIPIAILKKHKGYGIYEASGYDIDCIKIKEFAIPSEIFRRDWLIDYKKETISQLDNTF
ncbi:MAG: hypothetical protein J6Q51_03770 [Clostridia bacterium]|nr:hypothetical protein [Clostridia bacterium]